MKSRTDQWAASFTMGPNSRCYRRYYNSQLEVMTMIIADANLGYLGNIINEGLDAYILNIVICTNTE